MFSDVGISIFLLENASEIRIDRNLGKGRCESILPVFVNIDLLIRLKISVPKSLFIPVMRLNMIVRTFLLIWCVSPIFDDMHLFKISITCQKAGNLCLLKSPIF
ncbi:hypothetical protein HanPI659440_Chr11g0411461 [Helianthus annuus]|nr:hypothetical protein HanPI659440_Chr11g0411461 [Helianthus annuus]